MLTTRVTSLVGCSVPIQLAGMGAVWAPELAAEVTEGGGLGMLSGGVPVPVLDQAIDEVRTRTEGPFGVNFLMPFLDREAVDVAFVDFFYADPDPALVEFVHERGALAGWQVGSAREARMAADAGCDVVIAQGREAGGHVRGQLGLLPLLDGILDAVDVPVLAAGGIATPRALAAVLAAGADGARIGTRFVASSESRAHPEYIDALLQAVGEDTVLTEAFSSDWPDAPHRVLRGAVDAAGALPDDVAAVWGEGENAEPVARFSSMPPNTQVNGNIGAMALYAGEGVAGIRRVEPARKIVQSLAEEAEQLLRRWAV